MEPRQTRTAMRSPLRRMAALAQHLSAGAAAGSGIPGTGRGEGTCTPLATHKEEADAEVAAAAEEGEKADPRLSPVAAGAVDAGGRAAEAEMIAEIRKEESPKATSPAHEADARTHT